MRDYVTGEGLSEDDEDAHFLMLATTDPFRFKDAVKEKKWRKAVDAKIEAIERNDIMTKALKLDVFLKLRGLLGVCADTDIN
ncbi:hypothetical protein HRI_005294200 [Hibiscus trionum]|uniref:Uncharacterized protein n=1 Tax=Hibiscus trionum TaxID=183268 RepID=A0A9W7JKC8_HIBTR|nr:hypothetical protein HRI_005294200 [Hibiscus trionum]